MQILLLFGIILTTKCVNANPVMVSLDREDAMVFLDKIYKDYKIFANKRALANWKYATNLTKENLEEKLRASTDVASYNKMMWQQVNKYPWKNLMDANLKRQFQKLSILGYSILPEKDYTEFNKIISTMQNIYSTAKICDYKDKSKCDLSLDPELTDIMAKSRNADELKYVWAEWRKVTGKKVKPMFEKYVELSNKASRLNNFTDTSDLWLESYEAADIRQQIESLWNQVKPLYLQIHAYVRHRLNKFYGDEVVKKDGLIPAHLLGNMWSQSWAHVSQFTVPYPDKKVPDVTDEMVKQGYTVDKMFRLAESCFTSMNMAAMPQTFWNNSVLEKSKDREMICHASAWDMSDAKDFRIKMCTKINMDQLMTVHHEMGHVQYYLQYKNQPIIYRSGANPGFHEAVGDVMSLSVSTPKHLKKINLLKTDNLDDPEVNLNDLYLKSLSKVVFLPYSYILDKWRWDIFQGKTTPNKYNCKWWNLRHEFQGIESPVDRDESDLDPAAKYHVVANVEYLRYFISHIIQFQFHKALCIVADEYDPEDPAKPLHNCDITNSIEAGSLLKSMLRMGSSRPWQDAMEVLTGDRKMDASGLLEYFQPLHDWLKAENKRNNVTVGWPKKSDECTKNQ